MSGMNSSRGLLLALTALSTAAAQDWPEYRGPHSNGSAPDARLPLEWSETQNVAWKTAVPGRAWSTPVSGSGPIWMTNAGPKGNRMSVLALDRNTGEIVHERVLIENESPDRRNALNSYASPSPVVADGKVFAHFGTYGTACLDEASGDVVWMRDDIHCDHLEGPGSSPMLVDDLLVFHMDGADVQFIIALDRATGETRWRNTRAIDYEGVQPDLRKAYSTPLLLEIDGVRQLVSSCARGTFGYAPKTGEVLWRLLHRGFSMSSRPLYADGMLYLNTGYMRAELLAVRPGKGELDADDAIAWRTSRSIPHMPSPVFANGRLFLVSDGGIASCFDAKSGETRWRKRLDGEHCASPIAANGHVYFFDREGRTTVVRADSDDFDLVATNQLGTGFMASPAVIGNALIVRTQEAVYRLEAPIGEPGGVDKDGERSGGAPSRPLR